VITLRIGDLEAFRGQAEAASMMASMLDKGGAGLTRQQVQDRLDELQAELRFGFTDTGALSAIVQTRRQHLPAAIELATRLLRQPSFDPATLEEQKRQALTAIEAARKEPEALLDEALDRHGNPYPRGDIRHARSFDERVQDVSAITAESLRTLHARMVGASRVEVGAVGDFDAATLRSALERGLGNWASPSPYARVPTPLVPLLPTRLVFVTPDKQNATLAWRLPVPLSDNDADYPALAMANYLLGAGGNSRLWKRVRETEGLSYGVGSSVGWSNREANSMWRASATFAPANRAKVEAAMTEEVARALREGFTPKELTDGKTGLLSFRRLSRAQDANLAFALAANLDLGRTLARAAEVDAQLQALTLEQVNAALRKYVDPSRFAGGVAGDFK